VVIAVTGARVRHSLGAYPDQAILAAVDLCLGAPLRGDAEYTVRVSNVQGVAGIPIPPGSTTTFTPNPPTPSGRLSWGSLKRQFEKSTDESP